MKKNNFKAHGYMTLSNFGGVEIEVSDCWENARLRFYGDDVKKWKEIRYNKKGRAFVKCNGRKYFLDQFMRVNYAN